MVNPLGRLLEDASPELANALRESGARLPGAPPRRAEIAQRLERRGVHVADAYLDLLERVEGLEVRGLKIGLATAHASSERSRVPDTQAIPIAKAPSDAVMWIDVDGTVYDDTDLERAVPVGRGAAGLLEYWLLAIDGQRWSGAVHDWYLRLAHVDPDALPDVLPGPLGELAVGDGLSSWSARACELTDLLDFARPGPRVSAVVSTNDRAQWIDALLRVHRACPEVLLILDSPAVQTAHPDGVRHEVRRIRCRGRFSDRCDGWLVIGSAADGTYSAFLEPA